MQLLDFGGSLRLGISKCSSGGSRIDFMHGIRETAFWASPPKALVLRGQSAAFTGRNARLTSRSQQRVRGDRHRAPAK
jgi:hypothetical protein